MDELELLEACGYEVGEEPWVSDIKIIRQNLGLSQAKFAARLTVPLRTLQAWETGERHCPAYIIRLIEHWAKHSTAEHGDWL